MDAKSKLIGAGCVLAIGLLVAMCFRHEQSAGETAFDRADRLVITSAPEIQAPLQLTPVPPSRRPVLDRWSVVGQAKLGQSGTTADPLDSAELPPDLAPQYPGHTGPHAAASNQRGPNPFTGPLAVRTHKVVDGDTLTALAERYLGSADRAAEIYQLNRDRLLSPELLPIGVELRIPVSPTEESHSVPTSPFMAKSPSNLMPRLPPTPIEQ